MPIVAVLADLLLLIAALGASWWWRWPEPHPWYGNACYVWGVFFLAVYITWPTLKSLGV